MNGSNSRRVSQGFLISMVWLIAILSMLAHVGQAFALNIAPSSVTIPVGGSAMVAVTDTDGSVSASSSATTVATVTYASGKAKITGMSVGTATVTVADNEERRHVTVTVVPALAVSPASVSITVGGNATVSVTSATGAVTASSSNAAVATVTYAAGTATIHGVTTGTATVTIADSFNSRQVSVTVGQVLTVSPTSVSVPVGGNVSVSVTHATGTVRATSANTAIATVTFSSDSGTARIHGVAAGSTTITIRDSLHARTVTVMVVPAGALTVSPMSVSVPVGGNAAVSVTNATGSISASSSNTAIARVTYASGTATIHGVAAGSATITISDSLNSRTVAVTVVSVATLTISPTSVSIPVGSNAAVSVTNTTGTVTATSSNSAIATVTYALGTATIHGVAAGSATITISDSLNSRTVAVTVVPAAALTVSPTSVSLPVGGSAGVSVTNATGTVTATSSNTAIATVSYSSGTATIHGVAVGTATITIRDSLNSRTVTTTVVTATAGNFTLLAWNNLGMHCFDGVDYSVFAILPPLNTLFAQLQDKAGALVTSGVTVTYQATTDTRGSINTISSTKTNFWQYVKSLFGLSPAPDVGLLGYPMASNTPATMAFNASRNWFEAVGIPITNHDDAGVNNEYPMVQVVAKNTAGQVLATTKVVLPVSDELKCSTCHTSNTSTNAAANAARPNAGWVFDPDPLKDWKKNILRLHDEKQAGNAAFISALTTAGYPTGLFNSAAAGKPVLCVACHVSNAYQIEAGVATGIAGISPLTSALHTLHGTQIDPATGLALDNELNRTSCYMCHPGSVTQCLRGAMSGPAYQCQSCHGKMSKVGEPARAGWLSEPDCQACHNSGQRRQSAVDGNGNLLTTTDQTFATTPNQPSAGFNLFRFSTGHGGVKCEACHGSTHAEFPSIEANDNVQSIAVQGHAGTVRECTTCHTTVPNTANGGPHGLHTIGNQWVSRHPDQINAAGGRSECAYCHGADFRGTPLSAVKMAKTLNADGRTVAYAAGQQVSCYDCHNGPSGGALTGDTKFASGDRGGLGKLVSDLWAYMTKLGKMALAMVGTQAVNG